MIGSVCGAMGMYASYYANVPSGTMIVLVAATGFVIVGSERVAMIPKKGACPAICKTAGNWIGRGA